MSDQNLNRQIMRGINASVTLGKRGIFANVFMSKKRQTEMQKLATHPVFQAMELDTSRGDRNVFRGKVENASDAVAWLDKVALAAQEVGVVNQPKSVSVPKVKTSKEVKVKAAVPNKALAAVMAAVKSNKSKVEVEPNEVQVNQNTKTALG